MVRFVVRCVAVAMTAYYAMFEQARLRAGHTIMVHSAAGASSFVRAWSGCCGCMHTSVHRGGGGGGGGGWGWGGGGALRVCCLGCVLSATPRIDRCVVWTGRAGGVGTMLCQMGKIIGCTVVGVVGATHKVRYALSHGCHYVIDKSCQDLWTSAEMLCPDGFHAVFGRSGVSSIPAVPDLCSWLTGGVLCVLSLSPSPPSCQMRMVCRRWISRSSTWHRLGD